jgi:hypothetical protein
MLTCGGEFWGKDGAYSIVRVCPCPANRVIVGEVPTGKCCG